MPAPKTLAGTYKLNFRLHIGGKMLEPGTVVDLSHEDAEMQIAIGGAVLVPADVDPTKSEAPPTAVLTAIDTSDAQTPALETVPTPPKGDRKQK